VWRRREALELHAEWKGSADGFEAEHFSAVDLG
jgi:hypothetical protein